MLEKVAHAISEHGLIAAEERVLVAVSGGPDSIALLHLLHRLAPRFSFALYAAHLDHALRPESADEAQFVAGFCAELGVKLTSARRAVLPQPGRGGLEQEARRIRRLFLTEVAAELRCAHIALGHHRGDQAETFLLRLLRGSGPTGLAAMRPRRGRFIRPLLAATREEIISYLDEQGLEYLEDPSNVDVAFTRNRIRYQLLPLLRNFNPQIDSRLGRLTRRLAREEDFWRRQIDTALPAIADHAQDGWRLSRPALQQAHPALRDRLLRRVVEEVRGDLRGIEEVHLDQLISLLETGPEQGEVHLPGLWAGRRYEKLWLRRVAPEPAVDYRIEVPGPGRYALPGGTCLIVSVAKCAGAESRWSADFDLATASFPLVVRSFSPGDRFHPAGMQGRKKIKDLFIEKRIEKEQRRRIPLILSGGEIIWVVGLRRCAGHPPCDAESGVLRIAVEGLCDGG